MLFKYLAVIVLTLHLCHAEGENDYHKCQKREVDHYTFDMMKIQSDVLSNSIVEYDSDGFLTRFETRFAIKGKDGDSLVQLSPTDSPTRKDKYFVIDFHQSDAIYIRTGSPLRDDVPNSIFFDPQAIYTSKTGVWLTMDKFTPFYLKLNNGYLEVGKIGSAPIIQYSNDKFKEIKFFSFAGWERRDEVFLYDCPAGFEESLRAANLLELEY